MNTRAPSSLAWLWSRHQLVELHFAGANSRSADRVMWRHLRRCETCRVAYGTHALCEASAPDGDQRAEDRLARTLFAPAPSPPSRLWLGGGAALIAAAALLLVPRVLSPSALSESGFHERGGVVDPAAPGPTIALYRVGGAGKPERAGAVIHAGEALAFSYTNPPDAAYARLMIFAHDDAGHVFWYWPAWRDPATSPAAISIDAAAAPVELGEAVKHPLPPGPLTLTALFTNQAYDVHRIEAALAGGAPGLGALQGRLVHERVEVLP